MLDVIYEPCGSLELTVFLSDIVPLIETNCLRLLLKE